MFGPPSPMAIKNCGRLVGTIAALASVALEVVLAYFNPFGVPESETINVCNRMIIFGVFGIIACLMAQPLVMYVVFFASFIPVGLHTRASQYF